MEFRSRSFQIALSLSTCALILLLARTELLTQSRMRVVNTGHHFQQSISSTPKPIVAAVSTCSHEISFLSTYNLTPEIQFAWRDIVAVQSSTSGRPSVTHIDEPLFDSLTTLKLTSPNTTQDTKCLPPLQLQVSQHPPPREVDASSLLFGMQTTIPHLQDTVKHLSRWLSHTNTSLHAIVQASDGVPTSPVDIDVLQTEFFFKHMKVMLHHPLKRSHTLPQRYFSIVQVLYEKRTPETKWIVLMDDDTLFPSIPKLLAALSKIDHTIPQYLGAPSEDANAVRLYGPMAFGGAGVFLSVPLARILSRHAKECNTYPRSTAGDITVYDCVRKFSNANLISVEGLHQMDLYVDQSGVYESGRELLSVHHWKGEGGLPIEKMHSVADVCGDCWLQRWTFPGELLLTNGFSITHYPFGELNGKVPDREVLKGMVPGSLQMGGGNRDRMEKIDLAKVEGTWLDWDRFSVEASLGSLRPKMMEGRKVSFKFLDSAVNGGVVRQLYVKRGINGQNDMVMVLNWSFGGESKFKVDEDGFVKMSSKAQE